MLSADSDMYTLIAFTINIPRKSTYIVVYLQKLREFRCA